MRNSRSDEHVALNKPPVVHRGMLALARCIPRCSPRTRALASAAEMVWDDELDVMLLRAIEADVGFRCRLVEAAEIGGYDGDGDADVVER